jgi:hypothetical protein
MGKIDLPFRQIHLDFHTSELIEGIGKDFDPDEFADTLAQAHVNQICCFARCHHGMIYYDSKLNPERVHPHLVNRNLLPEQIEACHKRGIRVPIYTSIQWDYYTSREHPEWLCLTAEGAYHRTKLYEPGFYRMMCVNTPYRDFFKAHVKEIFELMPAVDGFFFDIVGTVDCSCRHCQAGMEEAGLDPAQKEDRLKYAYDMLSEFMFDMNSYVRQFSSDCSVYFNNGRIGPNRRKPLAAFTHLEFDALPGGHPGGYKWLPARGRFERNLGVDCVAQTGKFHTAWGDFHSFKNLAALQYECFQALSLNCKCLIGDQLLPSGRIEKEVYELVGKVYDEVEEKEPWCRGAKAVTDIGVLYGAIPEALPSMGGVIGMLVEGGHQFDVIDNGMDFSPYKVLILPDKVYVDEGLAGKIDRYVEAGGRLLASFESGMDADKTGFLLRCLPVTFAGDGPIYSDGLPVRGRELSRNEYADYVIPAGPIGEGLPETEHVMYTKGVEVAVGDGGAKVLADVIEPVFYRTWNHFCSHRHAPSSGKPSYPAIVRRGNVIYFGHAVFDLYAGFAPLWVKKMALNALKMLLPDPVLSHDGPSTLEATVNAQEAEDRWVVHLLHYIPLNRARNLSVIEDVVPLYDVTVSVKVPQAVRGVVCVPENEPLTFEHKGDRVEFVLPRLVGHQMIALSFA